MVRSIINLIASKYQCYHVLKGYATNLLTPEVYVIFQKKLADCS